jgi:selenocysteine lyase/cysteine desulfurase
MASLKEKYSSMDINDYVGEFRKQLPQLQRGIYFNHAALSVLPTSVRDAAIAGVKLGADYATSSATKREWVGISHETRELAAELIGASPQNVAFAPTTSTALSLISLAIPWRPGENVITSGIENPATIVPWQNLGHLGVEVRYLPADEDDLVDLDALGGLVDARTRLVALSLVEYCTGQRLDIEQVVAFCKPRGILVSVDAVQAVGAVPVDVGSLGVNFLSAGAQKWLIGPRNIGLLYADDTALEMVRSPIVTERCVADIDAEEEEPTSGIPQLKVNEGALKLEPLPYNDFAGICGLRQALRNLRQAGERGVHERLRDITDELVKGLKRLDGRVVSPRGDHEWSGVVSFAPARANPKDVVARLREEGVYVAVRKGRLRISPHYYNTSEEVARFLSLMDAVC